MAMSVYEVLNENLYACVFVAVASVRPPSRPHSAYDAPPAPSPSLSCHSGIGSGMASVPMFAGNRVGTASGSITAGRVTPADTGGKSDRSALVWTRGQYFVSMYLIGYLPCARHSSCKVSQLQLCVNLSFQLISQGRSAGKNGQQQFLSNVQSIALHIVVPTCCYCLEWWVKLYCRRH